MFYAFGVDPRGSHEGLNPVIRGLVTHQMNSRGPSGVGYSSLLDSYPNHFSKRNPLEGA